MNNQLTKNEILTAAIEWIKSRSTSTAYIATQSRDITLTWEKQDIIDSLQDLMEEEQEVKPIEKVAVQETVDYHKFIQLLHLHQSRQGTPIYLTLIKDTLNKGTYYAAIGWSELSQNTLPKMVHQRLTIVPPNKDTNMHESTVNPGKGITTEYVCTADLRNLMRQHDVDGGSFLLRVNELINRGVYIPIQVTKNDEAVNLLTALCGYVEDRTTLNPTFLYSTEIPGLKEWWAARKPKSEREQKLEAIMSTVCRNKDFTTEQQAE